MSAQRSRSAGGHGFTFIETMIAMALLAFIVGDLAMVTMLANRSSGGAQRLTAAISLAENALEHARNVDFNTLDLPANPLTECFKLDGAPVSCVGGPFFTRVRTVAPLPGGALADARSADVDVVVSWADAHGDAQQFRVVSVISRY